MRRRRQRATGAIRGRAGVFVAGALALGLAFPALLPEGSGLIESASPDSDPPAETVNTPSAPRNEVPPEVSGTLREGEVILNSPGRWTGSEPLRYSNRWERCGSDGCTAVREERGFLLRLVGADVGRRMRGVVTASNRLGSLTVIGLQSGLVKPRLHPIDPFPVVALRGYVTKRGTLVTRLAVRAPAGSTLRLTCRGPGCPLKRALMLFRRHFVAVRSIRGRTIGDGALIELRVTNGDRIGKYTRFRFRRNRRPARLDRCTSPDSPSPVRCPGVER